MSLISTPTSSTHPALLARRAAVHHGEARWRGRLTCAFLVCVVVIASFMFYRGSAPAWMVLTTSLASQSPSIKTNDEGLRQLAIKAPSPVYPSASLATNVTGVVVAAVTIDVKGQLRSVKIVESPDAATGRAVLDAVRQWVFRPLAVPSTANLITGNMIFYFHLTGGTGVVSSSREIQAIKSVTNKDIDPQSHIVRIIDEAELRRLSDTLSPLVLDIRGRAAHLESHRQGAVNIPLGELQTRGAAEFPRARPIVIDCFAGQQHSGLCEMAVHVLTSDGFSQVAVLNRDVQ